MPESTDFEHQSDRLHRGAMNDLRTLEEIATYLRKSPATLRWMRHNRTGPKSGLIGGRIMYRQSDVDAWLEAQFAQDPTNAA